MVPHKMLSIKSQSSRAPRKAKRKKTKKRVGKKTRKDQTKTNFVFSDAMSAWAENFTAAATWQLKHQLAYWKARAISLEYENRVLCDVIRRNHIAGPSTSINEVDNIDESSSESDNKYDQGDEFENIQSENDSVNEDSQNEEKETGDGFEVSEEFIQFLTANAKYKEDAKRERELLKAKLEDESIEMEPTESMEQKIERSKELYGDKWQNIIALETSLKASFINELDKHKPMYWPNIPFNFTTS